MAQNKKIRFGPTVIASSVGNLYNPPTLTGGTNVPGSNTYVLITHLKVVNKTATATTVSLFVGATGVGAAGTEVGASSYTVPGQLAGNQNWLDLWFASGLRLDVADFLTGIAGAATTLTIQGEGEIGIA